MICAVMVVEGVLRHPDSDGHYDTGWALYQALAKNAQLHLLSHQWTEAELGLWLRKRHLTHHLSYIQAHDPGPAGRLEALERMRSWRVSVVIEPDPECAAAEIAAGWNTLLHTHALYTTPRWRPDHDKTPRPWDALTDEITRQQDLRLAEE